MVIPYPYHLSTYSTYSTNPTQVYTGVWRYKTALACNVESGSVVAR